MIHELKMSEKNFMYADTGSYNQLPSNWREITEAEFAQSRFFSYTPDAVEFRQAVVDENGPLLSLHLYWMFRRPEGFAIYADYWGKKLRFFQFGCDHEWQEVNVAELERLFPERKGKFFAAHCWHNYVLLQVQGA